MQIVTTVVRKRDRLRMQKKPRQTEFFRTSIVLSITVTFVSGQGVAYALCLPTNWDSRVCG
ncbi:MAG: hypothetical protein IIA07_07520 [Proteobacteria bacterium]|nr:hypothetical protein [Pseudomonadota bacterium]